MFDGATIAGIEDRGVLQGNRECRAYLPRLREWFVEGPEHVAGRERVGRYVLHFSAYTDLRARRCELDRLRAL